jgi:hypothetical protein
LLIVEVEEVGRVVYSVRGLSSTNHQSPITNHQSSIPRAKRFLVQNQRPSAVKDFWFLPGDSPHTSSLLRLFGFSPEGDTRTAISA